jgi:hypothetical protein
MNRLTDRGAGEAYAPSPAARGRGITLHPTRRRTMKKHTLDLEALKVESTETGSSMAAAMSDVYYTVWPPRPIQRPSYDVVC